MNMDQPYDGTIKSWIKTTCDWATIHGPVWYNRSDNRYIRIVTVILALVSCIGLPIFLSIELAVFANEFGVLTSGIRKYSMYHSPITSIFVNIVLIIL